MLNLTGDNKERFLIVTKKVDGLDHRLYYVTYEDRHGKGHRCYFE